MKIDLSNLSTAELDELISQAAQRRANLKPEHPKDPPQQAQAIVDPVWFTVLIPNSKGHIGLNIRHPGLGWLTFAIPPHEIANLMKFWAAMLAVAASGEDQGSTPSTSITPFSGGGTLH